MLERIGLGLRKAHTEVFSTLTPHPIFLIKHPIVIPAFIAGGIITKLAKKQPVSNIVGEIIGNTILRGLGKHSLMFNFNRLIHLAYNEPLKPWIKINGLGGRSKMVLNHGDVAIDGRIIKRMVIVYHDANKAGKHLDVHIGRRSFVYRITGKPVEKLIKYNSKGMLTEESKQALLKHLKAEIANNSRVAQNLDHSLANAKITWPYDENLKNAKGYGIGPTRQVILEDNVEFYYPHIKTSLHIYAPSLNPNQGLYLYQLYPGNEKRAPICIFGTLEPTPEKHYHDRLHLKLIQPSEFESKFKNKIDLRTNTRKYDGASCYFSSNGEVFKFFSPRISKETGKQIEYTFKLAPLADKGHPAKPVGMAEVLFWKKIIPSPFRGIEGVTWRYLSAAEIGGILNSNSIVPRNIYPELRVYRMDRWYGKDVNNLPFFENRTLQEAMVDSLGGGWQIVELVPPILNPITKSWEGFVGVPKGLSVNEGLKVKWTDDPNDWRLDSIELTNGQKGGIAGVVWFTSLESGKRFKLGPGQLGPVDRCLDMMEYPEKYIGRVAKVISRKGHEGRAAKFLEWHDSKGIW